MSNYKDVFDMVTDVRSLINIQSIKDLLGGGKIEPSVKSTGKTVKGIVVNGLSISNTADQIGYGNVNCYAPALSSTVDGKVVLLPDQSTLSNLAKAVKNVIDSHFDGEFSCWIEEPGAPMQDTDGSYFANCTYRYEFSQKNFKNI